MNIALSMIVSGNESVEDLQRALKSCQGQVDGMFIVITSQNNGDLKQCAEDMGAIVDYQPEKFFHTVTKEEVKWAKDFGLQPSAKVGDKIFMFDQARNHSMDMVPKTFDWMFWMDTDDILRGNKLRDI